MANLPEVDQYDVGVTQIETTDPVVGGVNGVANAPLKNLANRTKWLKGQADAGNTGLALKAPIASPTFTGTVTVPLAPAGNSDGAAASSAWVQRARAGLLTKSVAGNSDVTLTASEGGNGVLRFTGALTGHVAVNVPNAGKWIVDNQTSGSFTLTIKTAAGSGVNRSSYFPAPCGGVGSGRGGAGVPGSCASNRSSYAPLT